MESEPILLKFRYRPEMTKSKSTNSPDWDNEVKIEKLSNMCPADHIVISIDAHKYCHAIVEDVITENAIVGIIYFDNAETQCALDEYMSNTSSCAIIEYPEPKETKTSRKEAKKEKRKKINSVKKSTLHIDLSKVEIYKVLYDLFKEPCLTAEETLEKARKFVGKEKYNIFVNNDEHFAIYCKTGKAAKLFVIDPNDLTVCIIFKKT